jgi:heme-degrading monooxygenase HmoA
MVVKILIKREFKPGKRIEILNLLNDLRSAALQQEGYISGLTLTDPENTDKTLVIGTWQSLKDWHQWKDHSERKRIEAMLEIYQESPTTYEPYVIGIGLNK